MAPPEKLTDADVKKIRRRVRAGELQTDLATEYGVNRKTIRRRLIELEQVESAEADRLASSRRRRQAAQERRKLLEREQATASVPATEGSRTSGPSRTRRIRGVDRHYLEWLDRPKSMTFREARRARGDVRLKSADSTIKKWVEREDVDALLEQGWLLAD